MTNNIVLNQGSGGQILATDDIGGAHHQRIKVGSGMDGEYSDASYRHPFPTSHRLAHALAEIEGTYGDTCIIKPKSLLKFGRNDNVDTTEETVWIRGGLETYATGNDIDTISSDDASDTQSVVVEGHTLSGSDLTFVTQTATLNGQNKVVLSTPLYRATRIYNDDSTDFAGTAYCYEDTTISGGAPTDTAKIHLQTDGANNQSLKAATAFSSQDYGIITSIYLGVNRQQTRSVDFRVQVREFGKTFRTRWSGSCNSSSGTVFFDLDPCLIVKKNSDIRINATSSGSTTGVEAGFNSYLALVQ